MHGFVQTGASLWFLLLASGESVAPLGLLLVGGRQPVPRVLVVDDDPMVCVAIEVCLQRQGFEVTIADGGDTGMRALDAGSFDVMLVDIFMPHMRGFESIRVFHERAPDIPLIAMSGYAFAHFDAPSPDFLKMTIELGATICLRKPFTPAALLAAVNDCIAKSSPNAPLCK
jgi:CheY-like chemotaxis protein